MRITIPLLAIAVTAALGLESYAAKPLAAYSGNDSHVPKPLYERITYSTAWEEIWAKHLGTSKDDAYRPLFEIDFDNYMVVAIFRGKQIQIRQLEIDSVTEWKSDFTVIRFNELGYSIGATGKMPESEYKYPYAFVVIPKSNKTIILEEGVRQYKGDPPKWTEVIRLESDGRKSKVGPFK